MNMTPTSAGLPPAVMFSQVHAGYVAERPVLINVCLRIEAGERVALIGPNGAGKTTLLYHIAGLLSPFQGTVSVSGIEVRPSSAARVRPQLGLVFQNPDDQLFCPTVGEDVAFGPEHFGILPSEVPRRVTDALQLVGLPGFADRVPHLLSAGEKRLVALATVLSYQPHTLLLDEPSAQLDPRNRRRLIDLLRTLDRTQIIATHDLDLALALCPRTIILRDGQVRADGTSASILNDRSLLEAHGLELPLCVQGRECASYR